MKIISPKIPTTQWLDIFSLSNVDPKYAHIIENVSEVGIRLAINGEQITERQNCILLEPNEEFFIQPNWGVASVVAEGSAQGRISIRRAENTDIRSSMRKISGLTDPRVLTQTLTQVEAASIEGRAYYTLLDVTLSAGQTLWYNFSLPQNKTFAIFLTDITPFYTGFESKLYSNSTGMTNDTAVTIRNMNKVIGTVDVSCHKLTAAPTTLGILEDILLFVPPDGSNPAQRTASASSRSQGYLIFNSEHTLQVSLANSSGNANRVIFKIYWLEASSTITENP